MLLFLEADKEESGGGVEILFDRLMLLDLRRSVADLDIQAYAEMRSYPDPPAVIHLILQAVLGVFYPEELLQGEMEDWLKCRQVSQTCRTRFSFTVRIAVLTLPRRL